MIVISQTTQTGATPIPLVSSINFQISQACCTQQPSATFKQCKSKHRRQKIRRADGTSRYSNTVFSTGATFASQGIFGSVWRHFWSSQLEERCSCWHLVGRGQGGCSTFCNVHNSSCNYEELYSPKCQEC